MKDCTGKLLEVGDRVAYSGTGDTNVHVGDITSFTQKKVRILKLGTASITFLREPKRIAKVGL